MGVHVDEAGRDDATIGLDGSSGTASRQLADIDNPAILNGKIAPEPGATRAVDYLAPDDEDIVHKVKTCVLVYLI